MAIHIDARPGDVAPVVLLPGDPLRARYIAETFLQDAVCFNRVRNMLGFTGQYRGRRVSVQGTGMGAPSMSIYAHELIREHGCTTLLRVGTCGAIQPSVQLRDVILAMSACTNSGMNRQRFGGADYAPTASFELLTAAHRAAAKCGVRPAVGCVLSSDVFYDDDPDGWKLWARYGVLALEMETAELYTVAARHGAQALSLLTVSDHIASGHSTTPAERESTFGQMIELALTVACEVTA